MNMNSIRFLMTLLVLLFTTEIGAYRILGVFPVPYISHNLLFQSLMKGLAKQGHDVDIISHYEVKNPPKNYRTILNLSTLKHNTVNSTFNSIQETIDFLANPMEVTENILGLNICKIMALKEMQQIIKNPPSNPPYDLIITEGVSMSCYYGLGFVFKVPVAIISASLELPWISQNIGNPLSTAIFPTILQEKSQIKTFWDRLQNTVRAKLNIYKYYSYTENQSAAMRKYLDPNIPSVREVERSVALTLVNSHYTIFGIRPLTPAFVEIGGLHIEEDESNFTTELKQWMDQAKDGVVYVSFGTTLALTVFPNKTLQAIYSSFAKLAPIKVLMKASNEEIFPPGLPENVKTLAWIPQIPVLRHKNTKVFIMHGGLHSVEEAIYFGIPIIGVPIFYDQRQNINVLINKKMGVQLYYNKITEQSLDEALLKTLKDPRYKDAAKYHSRLFRDRPMQPMKTAIFWIEYVIRNGAKPLRSPAIDLYWWQIELLDVYAFLLLSFLIAIYLMIIIVKFVLKMSFRKDVKTQLKRD